MFVWHQLLEKPRDAERRKRSQQASLLGPDSRRTRSSALLDSVGARYHRYRDEGELLEPHRTLLAEEKVVGWFQGRAEFGPRALGRAQHPR